MIKKFNEVVNEFNNCNVENYNYDLLKWLSEEKNYNEFVSMLNEEKEEYLNYFNGYVKSWEELDMDLFEGVEKESELEFKNYKSELVKSIEDKSKLSLFEMCMLIENLYDGFDSMCMNSSDDGWSLSEEYFSIEKLINFEKFNINENLKSVINELIR